MEERVEKITLRDMLAEFLKPDIKEKETELPEELRIVATDIDEKAEKLIDRKYIPKKSVDLLRKNLLRNDLSVKDLKEATKSSPKIQGAEFIEKSNDEIEENIKSRD